jgi:hypothetical protein
MEDRDELCFEPVSLSLVLPDLAGAVAAAMGASSEAEAMKEEFMKGKLAGVGAMKDGK